MKRASTGRFLLVALSAAFCLSACAPEDADPAGRAGGKADGFGQCGDGSLAVCEVLPLECPAGTVREIVDGCFGECVDPFTCAPPVASCGDGSFALCTVVPDECPEGTIREVVGGCFGECVDPATCEVPAPSGECGDGSIAICEVLPVECPEGTIREVVGGCFGECVDPATCEPPLPAGCSADAFAITEACAEACTDEIALEDLANCLGELCPEVFALQDPEVEACMSCGFLRGEDIAMELGDDDALVAGEVFHAGILECETAPAPLD